MKTCSMLWSSSHGKWNEENVTGELEKEDAFSAKDLRQIQPLPSSWRNSSQI